MTQPYRESEGLAATHEKRIVVLENVVRGLERDVRNLKFDDRRPYVWAMAALCLVCLTSYACQRNASSSVACHEAKP